MKTHSTTIATLNDMFRKSNPAQYIFTKGIADAIPLQDVLFAVRHFSDFTEDNDPYGEHDFGSLELSGHEIFWKIDYYDNNLQYWCDPLSRDCRRTLTVMLAEEY